MGGNFLRSVAVNVAMFGSATLAFFQSNKCTAEKYDGILEERNHYRNELMRESKYIEYLGTYNLSPEALKAYEDYLYSLDDSEKESARKLKIMWIKGYVERD